MTVNYYTIRVRVLYTIIRKSRTIAHVSNLTLAFHVSSVITIRLTYLGTVFKSEISDVVFMYFLVAVSVRTHADHDFSQISSHNSNTPLLTH